MLKNVFYCKCCLKPQWLKYLCIILRKFRQLLGLHRGDAPRPCWKTSVLHTPFIHPWKKSSGCPCKEELIKLRKSSGCGSGSANLFERFFNIARLALFSQFDLCLWKKTDGIFVKMFSQMYLSTKKFTLNSVSDPHPDCIYVGGVLSSPECLNHSMHQVHVMEVYLFCVC